MKKINANIIFLPLLLLFFSCVYLMTTADTLGASSPEKPKITVTPGCLGNSPRNYLSWNADASGNTLGYNIYRRDYTLNETDFTEIASNLPPSTTQYTDTGIAENHEFVYRIDALGEGSGNISSSDFQLFSQIFNSDVVGHEPAIAIGLDGFPVISYYNEDDGEVMVTKCFDNFCSHSTTTQIAKPSGDWLGYYGTSIAVAPDGLPIIAADSLNYNDLIIIKCNNTYCSNSTTTRIPDSDYVGDYPQIAIGADGLPVVSYYNYSDHNLMVTHCDDAYCSSYTTKQITSEVADYGDMDDSSLTLDPDGYPVIAFYNRPDGDLMLMHCYNPTCTSYAGPAQIEYPDDVGQWPSVAIGIDGFPVISHYNYSNPEQLMVTKCLDEDCWDSTTSAIIVPFAHRFPYTSIAVPPDGLPVITTQDEFNNGKLVVTKCLDPFCRNSTNTELIYGADWIGYDAFVKIGSDGLPIIASFTYPDDDLLITKCGNLSCSPLNNGNVKSYGCSTMPPIDPILSLNYIYSYLSDAEVSIKWTDAINEDSYQVFRKDNGQPFDYGSPLVTLPADVLAYIDYTAEGGKTYQYQIRAVNTHGSSTSNIINAVIPFGYPQPTRPAVEVSKGCSNKTPWNLVKWSMDPTGNTLKYNVYRKDLTLNETDFTEIASNLPPSTIQYIDVGVAEDHIFTYRVEAVGMDPVNTYFSGVQTTIHLPYDDGDHLSMDGFITMGADGLPIIAFRDYNWDDLVVTKCYDNSCSLSTTTRLSTVGSYWRDGWLPSIAVPPDGLPVAAHFSRNYYDLVVTKCNDPSCFTATHVQLEDLSAFGDIASIAISTDGFPIIASYDAAIGVGDIAITKCYDPFCNLELTHLINNVDNVGWDSISMTIAPDGFPIIAYGNWTDKDLMVTKCYDDSCYRASTTQFFTSAEDGMGASLAVAPDGLPVISHGPVYGGSTKVTKCLNASCSLASTTPINLPSTEIKEMGNDTSLAIASDGFPIISYTGWDTSYNDRLIVTKCYDSYCSNYVTNLVANNSGPNTIGNLSSLAIGSDGLPIISSISWEDPYASLWITKCSNNLCNNAETVKSYACSTLPPIAPILSLNFVYSTTAGAAVSMSWTDAINEESYQVFRKESGQTFNYSYPLVTLPADVLTYIDYTAEGGKTYQYQVRAINMNGLADSNTINVKVPFSYPQPQKPTINVSTGCNTSTSKNLINWSTDPSGNTLSYNIYRKDITLNEADFTEIASNLPPDTVQYIDEGVAGNHDFIYRLEAVGDIPGNSYFSDFQATIRLDYPGDTGHDPFVAIGSDGLPIIAHVSRSTYGTLLFTRCYDQSCLNSTTTQINMPDITFPGDDKFICNNNSPYDWQTPQNNNYWQGVSGINNPCPSGWRLPTSAEWQNELDSWSQKNYNGAFASPLKLTAAGTRTAATGNVGLVGSFGTYWSSTPSKAASLSLFYYSVAALAANTANRANGYSVRCIKDSSNPAPCGDNVSFRYKGVNVTYGSVNSNGNCWLDRNLGASQAATAYNDASAYGDLFQWGRPSDGHQNRNSAMTTYVYRYSPNDVNGYFDISIAIPPDGLPVITSSLNVGDEEPIITKCLDPSCLNYTNTVMYDFFGLADAGNALSLAIGTDGLPIFSRQNNSLGDAMITHCVDSSCSLGYSSEKSYTDDTTMSWTPADDFILLSSSDPTGDWRIPQKDNLWQGVSGINNPCPSGWRLPTKTEWDNEITGWSSKNTNGAFASPLKLSAGGMRDYINYPFNGTGFSLDGTSGWYWSSTVTGDNAAYTMWTGGARTQFASRAYGESIRCIKDESTVFNCGDNVAFTYNGASVTYGTVMSTSSACWLDRNLGASRVATAYNDASSYGDLFQWGRMDDSHQVRNRNITIDISNSDWIDYFTSLAIGSDGLPIVAYANASDDKLVVSKCLDIFCLTSTTTQISDTHAVGYSNSITIGADGLPIISHLRYDNGNLVITKCNNLSCSVSVTNEVANPNPGQGYDDGTSISIGSDGLPIISWADEPAHLPDWTWPPNEGVYITKCYDASCQNSTTSHIIDPDQVDFYPSLAIGADGLPIVAYYNESQGKLTVTKCGNLSCSPLNNGNIKSYACSTEPPIAPVLSLNFVSAVAGNIAVSMRWTDAINPDLYQLFRRDAGGSFDYGSPLADNIPPDVSNYVDYTVEDGKTYEYQVKAINANGSSTSNIINVPIPIAKPGSFILSGIRLSNKITLNWTEALSTAAGGEVTYTILRSDMENDFTSSPTTICTTAQLTCDDDNLPPSQKSYYRATAVNKATDPDTGEPLPTYSNIWDSSSIFNPIWKETSAPTK